LFVALKPLAERDNVPTQRVIDRLRRNLQHFPASKCGCSRPRTCVWAAGKAARNISSRCGSSDLDELLKWVPKAVEVVKTVPDVVDVSTDREQGGFQLNISIDRQAAARLGVRIQDLDAALANAYSQRQVSTIYTSRTSTR